MSRVDRALQEPAGDGPQVKVAAIFDLDRTITTKDTFIPFLLMALRGRPYRVFHAVHLPFAFFVFRRGWRDNGWLKQVFLRAIAGGATRRQIRTWSDRLLSKLMDNGINSQALEQLDYHRRSGHRTILISASYDFYVRPLADAMGFDDVICTEAAWTSDSRLSGTSSSGNCYGPVKLRRLQERLPVDRKFWRVVAYADHCSDLPLLQWADQAVVVNPGPAARQMARSRNFEVRHWR
ncbi:HAD family hydrolase [Pseudomonadota bacterium]